jgi:hypothetical protein
MTSAARYFVPICLYPHTKYRTRDGVTTLFDKYDFRSHDYLVVIADRLLALDRLVKGRYWTVDTAFEKARRDAQQVFNLIRRSSYQCGAQHRGKVVYWDEIAGKVEFGEFSERLRREFLAEKMLAAALEDFIDRRVERLGLGSNRERERHYEREYLLSEVCMSVFCTEILGFWVEIWERQPAPEIPDPLRLLYCNCPELVVRATGRSVSRALKFLFEGPSA